ncbi:DUF1538 domain-containing protein [Methanocalculus sp. MC3]
MASSARETFREVIPAVGPIAIIVLLMMAGPIGIPIGSLINYFLGFLMLTIGITLFLIGVENGLLPMGEAIGSDLPQHGSLLLVIITAFSIGFVATLAEPGLQVFTEMIDLVSNGAMPVNILPISIAMGVGFFVTVAMIRIVFNVPFKWLVSGTYLLLIALAIVTPADYLQIAFDGGGATTGPMTVPFILALGIGLTSVLAGRSPLKDGFGLVGLAAAGPVIGIMLTGLLL